MAVASERRGASTGDAVAPPPPRVSLAGVASRLSFGGGVEGQRLLKRLVEAVGLALAAFFLARLLWTIFAPLPTPVGAPALSDASAAPPPPAFDAARNPFATAAPTELTQGPAAAPTANPDEIAETDLDLTLHGTWTDPEGSAAIIAVGSNPQKTFYPGDAITRDARLDAIYDEWVAIDRGGVTESLWIAGRRSAEDREAARRGGGSGARSPAPGGDDAFAGVGDNLSLTDVIEFEVEPAGDGLRVLLYPGLQAGAFAALGFAPGDVLLSINGAPADAASLASGDLLEGIEDDPFFTVTVERGGETKNIAVEWAPGRSG